jgi:anti-anti-sigma factor
MGNPTIFHVDGEFTIYRATELHDAFKAALAGVSDGDELEVDLSSVTEMDSAGVQLLLAARKTARASGREMRLSRRSPAVDEVFETLQLAACFDDMPPSPSAAPTS